MHLFARSLTAVAGLAVAGLAGADTGATTSSNADEVRAIVAEMLADAETRSSLLQGGGSAGYDGGFYVNSADGAFNLRIRGQAQFQYQLNSNDNDAPIDDFDHDFVNRRTKLKFDGHVYDDWSYKIQGRFAANGGGFGLEDAYVDWAASDDFNVRFGQFKLPFLAEELTSSTMLQGAERSFTNEWFTLGRSQGVMLHGGADMFRWMASFSDGANVMSPGFNGQNANSDIFTPNTDYAFTGRAEFLFSDEGGSWDQFDDTTSASDDPMAWKVGVAGNWQEASDLNVGGDQQQSFGLTADVAAEFGAGNVLAYLVWQSTDDETNPAPPPANFDSDQFAFGLQGGIHLVPDEWELFGRYEYLDFDNPVGVAGEDSLSLITIGVINYIHGHSVKWTTQLTYALDEVPATVNNQGLIGDASGADGQISLISQLQLLF